MASTNLWQRVKSGSKTGFDKAYSAIDKLGAPINKLTNKIGSEAFWPTTLDKESDKAARILKSFCKDGFYAEDDIPTAGNGPKQKQRVVKKIPMEVVRNAKALCIFTTMRTGLWVSGAGGSGILIARQENGQWSPPSGIMLHTAGLGFMVGIDIYDCVVVINSTKALEAFYNVRCTLGSEISVVAGPVGVGGVLETEIHKRQAPVFTYLKSRGFYAGVQIDGTIVIERTDENEKFYGERIGVKEILNGKVKHPPFEIRRLLETIKAAQGDADVDESFLPTEAPPGDFEVDNDHVFGVPDREDPDPYGVLALEKEGMGVREAATKARASWVDFSFNPSPSSPAHKVYQRSSGEHGSSSRPTSWRKSGGSMTNLSMTSMSTSSTRHMAPPPLSNARDSVTSRPVLMTSTSTQTDETLPLSPGRSSKHGSPLAEAVQTPPSLPIRDSTGSLPTLHHQLTPPRTPPAQTSTFAVPEPLQLDDKTHVNIQSHKLHEPDPTSAHDNDNAPLADLIDKVEESDAHGIEQDDFDLDEDIHIEEPVVHSIQSVQTVQAVLPTSPIAIAGGSKARIVTVGKRIPPKLPPRNPNRVVEGSSTSDGEPAVGVDAMLRPDTVVMGGADAEQSTHATLDARSEVDSRSKADAQDLVKDTALPSRTSLGLGEMMKEIQLDDDDEDEEGSATRHSARTAAEERDIGRNSSSVQPSGMPGGFE